MEVAILFAVVVGLMLIGVPIAVSLGMASVPTLPLQTTTVIHVGFQPCLFCTLKGNQYRAGVHGKVSRGA